MKGKNYSGWNLLANKCLFLTLKPLFSAQDLERRLLPLPAFL